MLSWIYDIIGVYCEKKETEITGMIEEIQCENSDDGLTNWLYCEKKTDFAR